MIQVNVSGGTRAGWRIVRNVPKDDWVCPVGEGGCGKVLRYYWVSCPNCGHKRPER